MDQPKQHIDSNDDFKADKEQFDQLKCLDELKSILTKDQVEDLKIILDELDNNNEYSAEEIIGLVEESILKDNPSAVNLMLDLLEYHPKSNGSVRQHAIKLRITEMPSEIKPLKKHPAEEFFEAVGDSKLQLKQKAKARQHLLDYSLENPRKCFELFRQYEKIIVEAKIETPKIFDLLKSLPDISDSCLLKVNQIEESIRTINPLDISKGSEKLRTDNINQLWLPELSLENESVLDYMLNRLKDSSWLSYKKSEVLAINPEATVAKAKKISEILNLKEISLEEFNVVSFRFTKEEEQNIISGWLSSNTAGDSHISFSELLPLYFNLLKRSESWEDFTNCVNREIENKGLVDHIGFVSSKFLYYLFFLSADKELRVRSLQLYGKYNPVPLIYSQWVKADDKTMESGINHSVFFLIEKSLGIFSCGLGKGAAVRLGKSSFLNEIFKTQFEVNDSSPFSVNTVDIDLDTSFKPSRHLSIADAHGFFDGEKYFQAFCCLFKIIIVHVLAADLAKNKVTKDLKYLVKCAKESAFRPKLIFFVRDADEYISGNEVISSDGELIMSLFSSLSELNDYHEFEIHLLKNMSKFESVRKENLLTKIQKIVLGNTQNYENQLSFTKEVFVTDFLQEFDFGKFYQETIHIINDLLNEVQKYQDNFFDEKVFPFRLMSQKYRETVQILRKTRSDETARNQKEEQGKIERKRKVTKATPAVKKFVEILKNKDSYLIILEFSKALREFSEENTSPLLDKINKIKGSKVFSSQNQKIEDLEEEKESQDSDNLELAQSGDAAAQQKIDVTNLYQDIEKRILSVEIFWRELVSLFTYNELYVTNGLGLRLNEKIYEFLRKGEPFELVDGDNLEFCQNTLNQVFNFYNNDKIAVISVLGPQSSGKSTLLNYLYGCQFATSIGRCTKGIYCSLLHVKHEYYQYVLILDTEGLQSAEKGDDEFDKKITLFCLAVSQLILVNVKGEIHLPMKRLLEICILSLHELNKSRMDAPEVFFCFNQNAATAKTGPLAVQIEDMVKAILDINPEATEVANILPSTDRQDNIKLLSFAFQNKAYEVDPQRGIFKVWNSFQPISSFANECSLLAKQFLASLSKRTKAYGLQVQDLYSSFQEWAKMAEENWKTIDLFPGIYMFSEIKQIKQDRELTDHVSRVLQYLEDESAFNVERALAPKLPRDKNEGWSRSRRMFDNIEESILSEIEDFYNEKIKKSEERFQKIEDKKSYDPELMSIHKAHLKAQITALKNEQRYLLLNRIQQEVVQLGTLKGLEDITRKIREKINQIKTESEPQDISSETLTAEFEQVWSKMIAKMETQLELDRLGRMLFEELFLIYKGWTRFELCKQDDIRDLLNKPNQEDLTSECSKRLMRNEILASGLKNPTFYEKLETKLSENFTFLDLAEFYSQKTTIYYFNPNCVRDQINYRDLENRIISIIQDSKTEGKKNEIDKLFKQFLGFGLIPAPGFQKELEKIIDKGKKSEERVREVFNRYLSIHLEFFEVDKNFVNSANIISPPNYEKQLHKPDPIQKQEFIDCDHKKVTQNLKSIGNLIIQNFKIQYSVRPEYNKYNLGLSFLIDPLDQTKNKEPLNKINDNLKQFIKDKVKWDLLYKKLFEMVRKQISQVKIESKNNQSEQTQSETAKFSKYLMQNVNREVIQIIAEFNKDLVKLGFKLDMSGASHIHLIACVFSWSLLNEGAKQQLLEPIMEINANKETWKQIYISSIQNNRVEVNKLNAKNFSDNLLKNLRTNELNRVSQGLITYFDKIKHAFEAKIIQASLEEELFSREHPFDDVKKHVEKENNAIKEHFNDQWEQHFKQQKDRQLYDYSHNILGSLSEAIQVFQKLCNLINSKLEVEVEKSFDLFVPKNIIPNEYMQKQKYEKMFDKAAAKLFFDLISGKLNKNWSCQVELIDENKNETFEFFDQSLLEGFNLKLKIYDAAIKVEIPDFSIPFITDFLNDSIALFREEINSLASLTSSWTTTELNLDQVYNQLQNSSLGCPEECPACGRKCDKNFQHAGKHSCDLGHQIRGIKGVRRGRNTLSNKTCDEILPTDIIEVDETRMKWGNYTRQLNWDFQLLSEQEILNNRSKFGKFWDRYGKDFTAYYSKIFNTQLNHESRNGIETSHFIICLDGSGSMLDTFEFYKKLKKRIFGEGSVEPSKWEIAVKAAQEFAKAVQDLPDFMPHTYAMSSVIFARSATIEFKYAMPSPPLFNHLKAPGGGTSFDEPLKASIKIIHENATKYDMHFILLYTDGDARYPAEAVQIIKNLPHETLQRIQLICLCADKNPTILEQVTQEIKEFVAEAELYKNISPEELLKKLPEILVDLSIMNPSERKL